MIHQKWWIYSYTAIHWESRFDWEVKRNITSLHPSHSHIVNHGQEIFKGCPFLYLPYLF